MSNSEALCWRQQVGHYIALAYDEMCRVHAQKGHFYGAGSRPAVVARFYHDGRLFFAARAGKTDSAE